MTSEFETVFSRLRSILAAHAPTLIVTEDSPQRYCLEGRTGPSALKAWSGKMKRSTVPVAWVQIGKGYVSFHLMGVDQIPDKQSGLSKELKARMQGKTCFNFKAADEVLFQELERVTERVSKKFREAGFIE